MKVVIACDSFKESMSALEACLAVKRGFVKANPNVDAQIIPLADGGEGTSDIIAYALNGKKMIVNVSGPLGESIEAYYYVSCDGQSAFIEIAQACGLIRIESKKRNPMLTSTKGIADMIKDILNKGIRKIYVGLGGNCTNDGGMGMLQGLGVHFLNQENHEIQCVSDLRQLSKIDFSAMDPRVKECQIIVMSDVDNPFIGEYGATRVYAQQKGASCYDIEILEQCLTRYNDIVYQQLDIDLSRIKKTGSAGGLGGAFYLMGASLQSGIETVLEVTHFEEKIRDADYIVSGEGGIDCQSAYGKTISGVLAIANKNYIPVIALGGRVSEDIDVLYKMGLTAAFSIVNEAKTLSKALEDGEQSLEQASYNIMRLLLLK